MMHTLLSYIYLRKLNVTEENVYKLLTTADYLSILGVLDICCDFLESKLSPSNSIGIMLFARSHFCRALAEKAWKYIMRFFVSIATVSEELVTLSLGDLQEIINADELNVKSEETVWDSILRWINHDPEDRKKHIVSLMKCIRLGNELLEFQIDFISLMIINFRFIRHPIFFGTRKRSSLCNRLRGKSTDDNRNFKVFVRFGNNFAQRW